MACGYSSSEWDEEWEAMGVRREASAVPGECSKPHGNLAHPQLPFRKWSFPYKQQTRRPFCRPTCPAISGASHASLEARAFAKWAQDPVA